MNIIEKILEVKRIEREWVLDCNKSAYDVTAGMLLPMLFLESNGAMTVTKLAECMGITQQATGKIAKYMESKYFVELTKNPQDARSTFIELELKGFQALEFLDKKDGGES